MLFAAPILTMCHESVFKDMVIETETLTGPLPPKAVRLNYFFIHSGIQSKPRPPSPPLEKKNPSRVRPTFCATTNSIICLKNSFKYTFATFCILFLY